MPKKKITKNVTKSAPKKNIAAKAAKQAPRKVTKKSAAKAAKKTTAKVAKKSARKAAPAPTLVAGPPTPDLIAETAYRLYLERLEKGLPGDQEGDWLAAEQAVQAVQAA